LARLGGFIASLGERYRRAATLTTTVRSTEAMTEKKIIARKSAPPPSGRISTLRRIRIVLPLQLASGSWTSRSSSQKRSDE
jgi:hypothetical protein